jgi:dolichol-phosphate mannosyltransferase
MPLNGVSIVVPTYREAENLPRLVPQVAAAMTQRGWNWELIVVDDNSPDSTPEVLAGLARQWPQFRYLIRVKDRGLSSAVLAGMALATFDYIVVMDADLSHPPESIPSLIDPLLSGEAEFTIGSRYVAGGTTEDWGRFRWINSAVATVLSRPFARGIKDPMAGFFALPRELYMAADTLNPIGYKIGLELLVKCRVSKVVEVPIVFRNRLHGESKLTLKEQFRYLEHLSRLYDYTFPRGAPRVKFIIAGAIGAAACMGLFLLCHTLAEIPFLPALAVGLLGMILVTLLFFMRYVRTQKSDLVMRHPFIEFGIISGVEFMAGLAAGGMTVRHGGAIFAVIWAITAALIARYALRKVFRHDLRGLRHQRQHRRATDHAAPSA